mmetsp:Transcript_25362/g.83383  ORF Transcript_25362/g.83383 Transcript_25362/m.83383 type:complete len:200 (-) Transcript_25362:14-613(-)
MVRCVELKQWHAVDARRILRSVLAHTEAPVVLPHLSRGVSVDGELERQAGHWIVLMSDSPMRNRQTLQSLRKCRIPRPRRTKVDEGNRGDVFVREIRSRKTCNCCTQRVTSHEHTPRVVPRRHHIQTLPHERLHLLFDREPIGQEARVGPHAMDAEAVPRHGRDSKKVLQPVWYVVRAAEGDHNRGGVGCDGDIALHTE